MAEDAVAGASAHVAERFFQRNGVELAGAAAGGADDGVVALLDSLGAGPHRGRTEHAMQQPQLEQGGDVAVDGDAIDADAGAAQLAMQVARPERSGRFLQQLEQRAARAGDGPSIPPQSRFRSRREIHGKRVAQMQHCCIYSLPPVAAVQGRVPFAALLTSFGLIFIAELPDKTAYTVLLLATRKRPLPVLLGSWLAFLAQNLVAVALGTLLARTSPEVIRWTAALVFLVFGLLLLLREERPESPDAPQSQHRAFVQSFLLVFVAEIGDATQIGTAALVARLGQRWAVFIGSTLALWTVAALAVTIGNRVGNRIPKRALRKVAGVIFIVFAIVSVLLAEYRA